MSYSSAATSLDVSARLRRVKVLLGLLYVGVPLGFVGGIAAVDALWTAQRAERDFNYQALLVPAAMVLVGAWLGRRQRHRTAAWATTGVWLGGVAGVFVVFYAYTMQIGEPFDAPYNVLVYAGGLLLPVGWLLGYGARRILLVPPVGELADTPYDLVYPLRGMRRVRLFIRPDVIAVQERLAVPDGDSGRRLKWVSAGHRRLDGQVNAVGETALSGAEELTPALALQRSLPSTPGPALAVDVMYGDWMLPLDNAGAIADIIRRRMASLTGSES